MENTNEKTLVDNAVRQITEGLQALSDALSKVYNVQEEPDTYLTVSQAAAMMHCSTPTVAARARRGIITVLKRPHKHDRYSLKSIEKFNQFNTKLNHTNNE